MADRRRHVDERAIQGSSIGTVFSAPPLVSPPHPPDIVPRWTPTQLGQAHESMTHIQKRRRLDGTPFENFSSPGSALSHSLTRLTGVPVAPSGEIIKAFNPIVGNSFLQSSLSDLISKYTPRNNLFVNDGAVSSELSDVISWLAKTSLNYYVGLNSSDALLNFLGTESPIFQLVHPDREEQGRLAFFNLAQVNGMLQKLGSSHRRDQIVSSLRFVGYLETVTDDRNIQCPMGMTLSLVIRGKHHVVNIWATCQPKPKNGTFLHLLLVKRTKGWEQEEEIAYRENNVSACHDRIAQILKERFTASIAGIKSQTKRDAQRLQAMHDRKIENHQYWTIIPFATTVPHPPIRMIQGRSWKGHYWTVGRDYGQHMDFTVCEKMAANAQAFVRPDFPVSGPASKNMAEQCARTDVSLGRKGQRV